MKNYFLFELKRFLKDTKTLFMILTLFTFFGLVFYNIGSQGLGDQERELAEELNQTRILSQYAQQYNIENKEEAALAKNLSEQQRLIASQSNGMTFNQPDWYLESGIELAQLRLEMQENDSFSELPTELLPKEDRVHRDLLVLEVLAEDPLPIMKNSESAAGFLRESLSLFTLFAFAYLLVFASDILIDDFEHGTMFESYPVSALQKYASKLIIYSTGVLLITGLVMGISAMLVSFVWGIGNFNYPIGLYILGSFRALPLWGSILLFFLYYFVLAIHTFLLAMLINQYLVNNIATIILGLVLFILPYLYSPVAYYLRFFPFHYYNLSALFNGRFAMLINPSMDMVMGVIILLLYSLALIYFVFRKGKEEKIIS